MGTMSISRAITTHATERPHEPALTCGDVTLSWREFDRRTNRLARAFAALGVGADDLVTIALPNSTAFFESAFAVWKLGATPQPVSAKLPDRELEEIVELADSKLVVGVDDGHIPHRTTLPVGFEPDASHDDGELPDATTTHWKAPTSGGSTGRPKIILATVAGEFDTDAPGFSLPTGSTCVIPGVLYHNAPFSISSLALVGGNHVVNFPRFVPEAVLDAVTEHRPKYLYMVPTMMNRMWKLPDDVRAAADMSSLEVAVHMAAHCPPWLKEEWIDWVGPDVLCELYAGTEVQAITWITGREWREHRGSVGRPIVGKMKVVDDHGNDLPAGEVGEIYMLADGGRHSTYRYLGAEAKQLGSTDWESLGDMGWMDEDGYVYLADRRKDMILRGGANIYPAEVEAAVDEHPAVRSCAVIGIPDEDLGERVHAIVDAPAGVDEAGLRAHMAERLVSYKCPSTYEFVDEPVRDDAGKVRRSLLAAQRSG
ncbi:MAG: AMP-binding protein [Ilumatobacter sp.]|uniref:AMP-binding protein n=1 Tax=Ilumatobacter sp. TaxID=1967498 RepID=UPI00260C6D8D|nr:AMP-binding protein [Ilumatobacter sp.]MDJ0768941.1 AMP-binding protein [Ilumatobacter sp.]